VTQAVNDQRSGEIVPDGTGNAIVVWDDDRASNEADIFAQRIEFRHGGWGYPEPAIASVNDVPDDQGGSVLVSWAASGHDQLILQEITHYSVWRALDAADAAAALAKDGDDAARGAPGARLVTAADISPDFAGAAGRAVYRDTRAGIDSYWEWVGNQNAYYLPGYSYTAPTHNDSTASSPAVHQFMVMAHTDNPFVSWPSQPHGGYSVDNLAPAAPMELMAERVGNYVRLNWLRGGEDEPDFADYRVYRASHSGVTPELAFFLSATVDTVLWDTNADAGIPWYYIVTSTDYHGTESDPSNLASVTSNPTGIGDTPVPAALTLAPSAPNPFADATTLRFGVPDAGTVALEVFDVRGRRVAVERLQVPQPGWYEHRFDARSLPSGVYFYRITAAARGVQTRKLVIMR
jgi:hypothetical protein